METRGARVLRISGRDAQHGRLPSRWTAYIGTFTITAAGALYLHRRTANTGDHRHHRSGAVNTISFSTGLSGNYSLVYTNKLGGSTNWPAVGSSLVGDGNLDSLTHVDTDGAGFYRVVRTP